MKPNLKTLAVLSLLILLAATAFGGGQSSGASGAVTLSMSVFGSPIEDGIDATTGLERKGFSRLVEMFEAANPNITVELIEIPFEGRDQKMNALYMSDSIDVSYNWGDDKNTYLPGYTMVLDDFPDIDEVMARYPEWAKTGARISYGDLVITLPTNTSTRTLCYDKAIFDDLGMAPPSMQPKADEVYDLIMEANGKTLSDGTTVYGSYMDGRWMLNYVLDLLNDGFHYIANWDEVWTGSDTPRDYKVADWSFYSQENVDKLIRTLPLTETMPIAMMTGAGVEKWGTVDNDIAVIPFCNTNWMDVARKNDLTDRFIATEGIKDPQGRTTNLNIGGSAIATGTQHVEESWELLKFVTGNEAAEFVYDNYGILPIVKDHSFIPEADAYAKAYAAATGEGRNPTYPQYFIKTFRPWLNELMARYLDGKLEGDALQTFIVDGLKQHDADAAVWASEQ